MINKQQIRGARAMLGLTQAKLAKMAGMSTTALTNIENGQSDPKLSSLEAIRRALEDAGAILIPENGGGAGVRLRKPDRQPSEGEKA